MAKEAIGIWELNANGYTGFLRILTLTLRGAVGAKAFGDTVIGFWDEDAKKITFLRSTTSGGTIRTTRSTLGTILQAVPRGTFKSVNYLTGSFEAFEGSGGTANRMVFGWFARQRLTSAE